MSNRNKVALFIILLAGLKLSAQDTTKFHHLLLYQWNESAEAQDKQAFLNLFEALPEKVDGLESVSVSNVYRSSNNYDVLIAMVFSTKNHLKNYQSHKDHDLIVHKASELVQGYAYVQHSK